MRNTLAELVSGIRFTNPENRAFHAPRLDGMPRISVPFDVSAQLVLAQIVANGLDIENCPQEDFLLVGDALWARNEDIAAILTSLGTNSVWIESRDECGRSFGGVVRERDGGVEILGYLSGNLEANLVCPFLAYRQADTVGIHMPKLDIAPAPDLVGAGTGVCSRAAGRLSVVAAILGRGGTPAELAPADPNEERRIRDINKRRRLLKRPQILPCRPVIWNLTKVPAWEERQRAQALSHREQSRPHAVRGHQRHYRSGKVVSVRPHFRCGIPDHMGRDYRVRA